MKSLPAKWKRMPWRHRMMGIIVVLLFVLVAGKYVPWNTFSLPLPGTIAREYRETQELEKTLAKAKRREIRHSNDQQRVRQQARALVWKMSAGNPSTEVQGALERVARQAQVTISTMGRPRTDEISDTIRSIEISLNMRGTMREIGRFLVEMEKYPNHFDWTTCTIRPSNPKDPSSVLLTGRVAAYYLSSVAEAAVFKDSEEAP